MLTDSMGFSLTMNIENIAVRLDLNPLQVAKQLLVCAMKQRKQLVIKSFRFMSTAELLRFPLLMAFNQVTL